MSTKEKLLEAAIGVAEARGALEEAEALFDAVYESVRGGGRRRAATVPPGRRPAFSNGDGSLTDRILVYLRTHPGPHPCPDLAEAMGASGNQAIAAVRARLHDMKKKGLVEQAGSMWQGKESAEA